MIVSVMTMGVAENVLAWPEVFIGHLLVALRQHRFAGLQYFLDQCSSPFISLLSHLEVSSAVKETPAIYPSLFTT